MDSVMFLHNTDNTVDTVLISSLDSITFGYINSFNQGGMGNIILPGNATCDTQYISVTGCGGLTTLVYNGYTYDLVEIGGQCWFKENLQTSTYKDGTPINYPGTDNTAWANDTTGAYAWIDNDSTTYDSVYGKLYNWYAVDNSAGLCPVGWHVPSDAEWTVLESYLEANGYNYDGSTTGNKYAKAMADIVLWNADTGTGTVGNTDYPTYRNKSGFSGLPGGDRYNGSYYRIGTNGKWWSSTQLYTSSAWSRSLAYSISYMNFDYVDRGVGYSVRCLRD